jgi:hypothetical protein
MSASEPRSGAVAWKRRPFVEPLAHMGRPGFRGAGSGSAPARATVTGMSRVAGTTSRQPRGERARGEPPSRDRAKLVGPLRNLSPACAFEQVDGARPGADFQTTGRARRRASGTRRMQEGHEFRSRAEPPTGRHSGISEPNYLAYVRHTWSLGRAAPGAGRSPRRVDRARLRASASLGAVARTSTRSVSPMRRPPSASGASGDPAGPSSSCPVGARCMVPARQQRRSRPGEP